MTNLAIKTGVVSSMLFLSFLFFAYSQTDTIFITNYDVSLSTATNKDVRTRNVAIKVRSGDVIPYVELNNHKVELKISDISENKFSLETVILKKTKSDWVPITFDIPKQEGELGVPLKLIWEGGEYSLDVAIVVGIAPT